MKDTIYRQEAIDALCDNCNNVQAVCAHYPCKQYIAVEKLPSAQTEPKWIPCSKRLPEIGGLYIVCGKQKYTWENDWSYFVDAAECVEPDEGYIDCWTTWNDWDEGQENHIIAWMPLPEPYKGEDDAKI